MQALAALLAMVVAGCTGVPATAPVIGAWHELFYHERLGMTVLVNGGPESGQAAEAPLELWSWDGRS